MTTKSRSVSLLFVDNSEHNYNSLRPRLVRHFRGLGCALRMEHQANPDVAYDMTQNGEFDVVLVDLLFPPSDQPDAAIEQQEPRGLEVIEAARQASARTVIVVVTSGGPALVQHAQDRAADIVLARGILVDASYGGVARLVREIHERLCERGLLQVGPELRPDRQEPGIQAAVYEIGSVNLRLLLADLFQVGGAEPIEVELDYVTPGASGAHVIRGTATLSDRSTRNYLIKISRDQDALKREAGNYHDNVFGRYDPHLVVPYLSVDRMSGPRNGWSAIAMEFARDAVTLRRWLCDSQSAPWVPTVLGQLFLNRGLASAYNAPTAAQVSETPLGRLRLPPFRRVLVRHAVEQLAPLLSHPDGARVTNHSEILHVVEAFVREARIGEVAGTDTPDDLVLVTAHGDLHGANILVSADDPPRPLVIDLAAFGNHHWAADPARLMVDIVLRSLDHTVESYFWRRLPHWRTLMQNAADFESAQIDDDADNQGVIAALRWLGEQRAQLVPELESNTRWWEWHVALTEQLLRGAYQPDLPPAKRTFALIAAYDQIVTAERKLPPRRTSF